MHIAATILTFVAFTVIGNAQTWSLLSPAGNAPAPRIWSSAVFDPNAQRMLVFGGQVTGPLGDTWALTTGANSQWALLDQGGNGPKPRLGHSAVYDGRNDRMIVFGGGVGTPEPCVNDTWILAPIIGSKGGLGWTPLQSSAAAPPARVYHTAVYDPNTNRMIVFGGRDCSQTGAYFNDVWVLSNIGSAAAAPSWTQMRVTGTPPAGREGHTAVFDAGSNRMIVFGGNGPNGQLNDVWVLNNANGVNGAPGWSQINPSGAAPAPRVFATAVWDSVGNRMIVHGGRNSQVVFGDAFTISNLSSPFAPPTWVLFDITGSTPAKAGAAAVFDAGSNRMLVFGGTDSKGLQNDTWALNLGQQQTQPVTITTTSLPNAQVGAGYSAQLSAANGTPPYSAWTLATGSLPPGLKLDPATGLISGTPTAANGSPFSFTVTVKDAAGVVSPPQALSITIPANAGVLITTSTLPNATVGSAYSFPLAATGGTPPYGNWVLATGTLPPGLTLNVATGVISGIPATASGSPFNFSITVRDNNGILSTAQPLSIAVTSGITISPATLPAGSIGTPYSVQLTASNGTPPYTNWIVISGALPPGLSLNAATGVLSGTPSGPGGTFDFNVTVQDARNSSSTPQHYSIVISTAFTITSTSLPGTSVSAPYSGQLTATGGAPPYSNWLVVNGTLPGGLTLSPATGAILGIPLTAGTFNFSVTVKDNAGTVSGAQAFSIIVAPRVRITTTTLPNATSGSAYSTALSAADGVPPYNSWALSSGTLPAGLTLNAGTGVISGTAGGSGIFSFSVTVKDNAGGSSLPQNLSLTLGPAISLSPLSLNFSYRLGDSAPAPQSISVFSGGAFTVTTRSDQNFLVATPTSGQSPATIAVSINTAALRAGILTGQVIIALTSSPSTTATVQVTLTVEQPAGPQLQLSPARFSLNAVQGADPQHLELAVLNTGGDTLNFTAQLNILYGGAWVSLDNTSGSATFASPGSVGITVDAGQLNPGVYQADVIVQDQGSSQRQTSSIIVSVTARTLSIQLSQVGMQFDAATGGASSPPQTFAVANAGQGQLSWTVAVQTISGPDGWLIATPGSGVSAGGSLTPPVVTVSVDASKLTTGQYSGLVRVIAAGAANSPQAVTVVLTVADPAQAPPPVFSDVGALIVGDPAAPGQPAQISIANLTGKALSYLSTAATEDGGKWLNLTPATGTLASDRLTTVGVQTNFAGLAPGVRRGTLNVSFADGSVRTIAVTSVLPDNSGAGTPANSFPRQAAACTPKGLVPAFLSLTQGFSVAGNTPVSLRVAVTDTCGTPLTAGGVFVRFSNNPNSTALTHAGNGNWTGTWVPANLDASVGVVATAFSIGNSPLGGQTPILQGTIRNTASALPRADRIVDAASLKAGDQVALGSWASLFGDAFADGEAQAPSAPYGPVLGITEVRLGDVPLPLLYVNTTQVNALIPRNLDPNTQHQVVVLRGSNVSVPVQITVADVLPGIYTVSQDGKGQGAITIGNTGLLAAPAADNARPVERGETITIYLSGLGPVDNAPPDGSPAAVDTPSPTLSTPSVTIGDARADVRFSGLVPGQAGTYQIVAVVPDSAPSGDAVTLVVTMNGVPSNPVTIAVQ